MDTKLFLHVLAGSVKKVVNCSAVLASELLGNLSKFSHALFPVFEFLDWAIVFIKTTCCIGVFDVGVDLVLPSAEDGSIVDDEVNLTEAASLT